MKRDVGMMEIGQHCSNPKVNKSNPNDHQPISLLSIVSKLLERYVYSQIWDHLVEHAPPLRQSVGFPSRKIY